MTTITMFGIGKFVDSDFQLRAIIQNMEGLKTAVMHKRILSCTGLESISFYESDVYTPHSDDSVSDFDITRFAIAKIGADRTNADAILANCTEDTAETMRINAGYTGIYYRSVTLSSKLQSVIIEESTRIQSEAAYVLEQMEEEKRAKAEAMAKEKAELLSGVKWETVENTVYDENGKTKEYIHTLTINGETYKIQERNVFDVGICKTRIDGGMYSKEAGEWVIDNLTDKGWITEEISDNEKKAIEIVSRYGKYAKSIIRM